MAAPETQETLRRTLADLFCEVILPQKVLPQLRLGNGSGPHPEAMELALEGARAKVREVIERLPALTSEAVRLRLSPDFVAYLVESEYVYHYALVGGKNVMKQVRMRKEPADDMLRKFLRIYGFTHADELAPFKEWIRDNADHDSRSGASEVLRMLLEALNDNPKE